MDLGSNDGGSDTVKNLMSKSKRTFYVVWTSLFIIVLVPIIYFIAHVSDPTFTGAAMGNWFATILGVLSGGVIAYEIARLQTALQNKAQAKQQRTANQNRLAQLLPRIIIELRENDSRVERLQVAVNSADSAHREHWRWAREIVDGMSFLAYEAILNEGLNGYLRVSEVYVSIAYDMLRGLAQRVREADAAHAYHVDIKGDKAASDSELGFVRQLAREAKRRTSEAIPKLRIDRDILPKLSGEVPEAA